MLSYKEWKQVNESYDLSLGLAAPASVGIQSDFHAVLDEAKKKMKKKMFGDEEVPEDDEEEEEEIEAPEDEEAPEEDVPDDEGDEDEEEDEDEVDAETGDGEVVDPASKKDVPKENPLFARMKKMKGKMKKKMCAGDKKDKKKKMAAETTDNDWMKSVFVAPPAKNFDGLGVTEDALLPFIDPNTGLYDAAREPRPGQVGFAPQGIVGSNF